MTDSTATHGTRDTDGRGTEPTGATTSAATAAGPASTNAAASTTAAAAIPDAVTTEAATTTTASYVIVANVNVRSGPGTSYSKVATVHAGLQVTLLCQTRGQTIVGPLGTSSIWDRIGPGRYVSDTYVRTGSDGFVAPRC